MNKVAKVAASVAGIALIGSLSACGGSAASTVSGCQAQLVAASGTPQTAQAAACRGLSTADLTKASQAALQQILSKSFTTANFCKQFPADCAK